MKKFLLFLLLLITTKGFSQLEVGAGFASVAASDGIVAVASGGFQTDIDYDFMSESNFRVAVGTNFLSSNGVFAVAPGIKLGMDYVNLKVNYDFDGILWYGLGSRIGFGEEKTHGINLSLQAASIDGIGLGWSSIGYSYRF
tara:strand:+ start:762 stop:1184 length:423 start_codon:yes stop_codon:yes gene_type:complete